MSAEDELLQELLLLLRIFSLHVQIHNCCTLQNDNIKVVVTIIMNDNTIVNLLVSSLLHLRVLLVSHNLLANRIRLGALTHVGAETS